MTELDISLDIPKMPENLTGIIAYNPALEYTNVTDWSDAIVVNQTWEIITAASQHDLLGLADMTYLYYPPGHVEPGTSGVDNGTVPYLELDLQRVYDATKKLDQPPSEMADERNRYGVAFGHGRSEDRRDQAKHTLADIPEPPRQLWLKTECLCEFQGKIPQHSYTLSITFDRPVPDFPKYIKASNAIGQRLGTKTVTQPHGLSIMYGVLNRSSSQILRVLSAPESRTWAHAWALFGGLLLVDHNVLFSSTDTRSRAKN
ncbi:MAG: hypothetical protein Q9159_000367 [Coniocarpon cinnabarinum]